MEAPAEPPFSLKHRATGAFILLAIPVLILPWLLGDELVPIPVNATPATLEPTGDFISSIGTTSGAVATSPTTDAAQIQSESINDPPIITNTAPSADTPAKFGWVVRVGVFSEPSNLETRSGLLVSNGMRPQRENIDINGHTAVRIYLGPFPDLATAERESGKAMLVTGEPAFVVELP